jgi:hypothetical protein
MLEYKMERQTDRQACKQDGRTYLEREFGKKMERQTYRQASENDERQTERQAYEQECCTN